MTEGRVSTCREIGRTQNIRLPPRTSLLSVREWGKTESLLPASSHLSSFVAPRFGQLMSSKPWRLDASAWQESQTLSANRFSWLHLLPTGFLPLSRSTWPQSRGTVLCKFPSSSFPVQLSLKPEMCNGHSATQIFHWCTVHYPKVPRHCATTSCSVS